MRIRRALALSLLRLRSVRQAHPIPPGSLKARSANTSSPFAAERFGRARRHPEDVEWLEPRVPEARIYDEAAG